MRSMLAGLLLATGCASAPTPTVLVEDDPLTGAPTAYATVFLADDHTRLVLSAPVGERAAVAVTLWISANAVQASCDTPLISVGGHDVTPDRVESRVLETPSGADQTVAFTLPPAVLRAASTAETHVSSCGGRWSFDDEDRATVQQFLGTAGI